jgi:hypothetical protein
LYIEDIDVNFDYWTEHNLAELNEKDYEIFISLFNNPFDGKAAERVINSFKNV